MFPLIRVSLRALRSSRLSASHFATKHPLVPDGARALEARHQASQNELSTPSFNPATVTSRDDALSFGLRYSLPIADLTKLLGLLLHRFDGKNDPSIATDSRFEKFLAAITKEVRHGSAKTITELLEHLTSAPHCSAKTTLVAQCAQYAVARPNGFSPSTFVRAVSAISKIGVLDVEFIEFVRCESLALMAEFGPSDLHLLLDALSKLQLFNRRLIDLIVERMSEEIDRFTPVDIQATLELFARIGLVRAHVTRQLASLALSNTSQLTKKELISIGASLARLRFIKSYDYRTLIEILAAYPETPALKEIVFGSTLVPSFPVTPELRSMLAHLLIPSSQFTPRDAPAVLAAVYTVAFFKIDDLTPHLLRLTPLLIQDMKLPRGPAVPLLSQLLSAIKLEHSHVKMNVPPKLLAHLRETDKHEATKWEACKPLSEVAVVLSRLPTKYKLAFQRGALVDGYFVQLINTDTKIIIFLETPQDLTSNQMKMRHLKLLGYRPLQVDFWAWKTCKTEDQQIDFLMLLLRPELVDLGILNPKRDSPQDAKRRTATAVASKLLRS